MSFIALKMLSGDRAKYIGIIIGLTFTSLLITQTINHLCRGPWRKAEPNPTSERRPEADRLSANFDQNTIVVMAPQAELSSWATNNEVGLYGEQATPTGGVVTLAVEKDFRCLDRSRAEDDEADAYPHPGVKRKKI